MTLDVPTSRSDFRPTAQVDTSPEIVALLEQLGEQWPDGQPVRHRVFGTWGIIRTDSPATVPYLFDGKPRRVCIDPGGITWVSVVWKPHGAVPLRAWAPVDLLRHAAWR
ncbi:hypothetical protein ACIQPQ_34720 [Streptomyces sp. NPDC091281]|uniref:hypothetical protein n=1 Tax=Streptomyces sp. NPDC091281 TaxID=3365985 RepID=UPI0037F36E27